MAGAITGVMIGFAAFAMPVSAERLDMVVVHDSDTVELFMALPARDLHRVIGASPGLLGGADGRIDLTRYRTGTYELADRVFAGVAARADDGPIEFEAMSMMLHPAGAPLPLETRVDGLMATSVCGIPIPETPQPLTDLTAYVGLIAQVDGPVDALDLALPGPDAAGREARIAIHRRDEAAHHAVRSIAADGKLSIGPPPDAPRWSLAVAVFLGVGALLAARHRVARLARKVVSRPSRPVRDAV